MDELFQQEGLLPCSYGQIFYLDMQNAEKASSYDNFQIISAFACFPYMCPIPRWIFFIPSSIAQFFTWYLQYTHYMTPRIALFVSMLGCVTDKQVMYSV